MKNIFKYTLFCASVFAVSACNELPDEYNAVTESLCGEYKVTFETSENSADWSYDDASNIIISNTSADDNTIFIIDAAQNVFGRIRLTSDPVTQTFAGQADDEDPAENNAGTYTVSDGKIINDAVDIMIDDVHSSTFDSIYYKVITPKNETLYVHGHRTTGWENTL